MMSVMGGKKDSQFCTQTRAKDDLPTLCQQVLETGDRVYVRDKAGKLYLTLAAKLKPGAVAPIEVPLQRFKSHFSRFSSLVKDGVTFKILMRSDKHVFARRHSKYQDPLQDIVDEWISRLRKSYVVNDDDDDMLS